MRQCWSGKVWFSRGLEEPLSFREPTDLDTALEGSRLVRRSFDAAWVKVLNTTRTARRSVSVARTLCAKLREFMALNVFSSGPRHTWGKTESAKNPGSTQSTERYTGKINREEERIDFDNQEYNHHTSPLEEKEIFE